MCDQYTSVLTSLLDKHAPLRTKKVVEKAPTPWMTSKLLDCKRSYRQLERRWRRSRSGYDRSKYRNYRNLCNRLMTEAKSQYFSNLIDENSENPRRLWDTINNILHRAPASALPESNNVKSLCDHFAKYFSDKIRTIRANFSNQLNDVPSVQKPKIRTQLLNLEPASEDEVRKIIMKSASKSCDLDPIPTNILKALLDILIKPITTIINLSSESGTFPLSLKLTNLFLTLVCLSMECRRVCTWPSAFQFVHRSSKHHYFKLWIESSLIRRWYTNLHLLNRWHWYWAIKNASELYYRGIC